MAGTRMSMRKIREVLRLTHELGLTVSQVREATVVGKTAVSEYVSRAKVVGITWPIPPEISDAELERRLFTPAGFHEGSTKRLPDWTKVHEELKRRGVTLMILWEEHRAEHVDGHGYSRFCELDRKSTRLNSSHANISYAVFCLKKKKTSCSIAVCSSFMAPSVTNCSW